MIMKKKIILSIILATICTTGSFGNEPKDFYINDTLKRSKLIEMEVDRQMAVFVHVLLMPKRISIDLK